MLGWKTNIFHSYGHKVAIAIKESEMLAILILSITSTYFFIQLKQFLRYMGTRCPI